VRPHWNRSRSYASTRLYVQEHAARRLANKLEADGATVWLDYALRDDWREVDR
jgi:hypothetical protein